jgi:cytochrome c oxidase assembly factor CtaG
MTSRAALGAPALFALAYPELARAHGDRVPLDELATAWSLEPLVLTGALAGLALFAQAFLRLRARGRHDLASLDRAALYFAGVAVVTLALVSPLDAIGEEYLLSGHMLQHVLIGDLGPALILTALRGPLFFFLLPSNVLRALTRHAWIRAGASFLVRPRVSLTIWALVFAGWHVPAAYGATLSNRALHDLEHALFFVAGILVWNLLVDPTRRKELTLRGRLGAAVGLYAAGQLLAYVLVFSFDPLYSDYAAQDERLLGLSPLTDQRGAGVVMMVEQLVTLGTCAALLLRSWRRARDAPIAGRVFSPQPRA